MGMPKLSTKPLILYYALLLIQIEYIPMKLRRMTCLMKTLIEWQEEIVLTYTFKVLYYIQLQKAKEG